MDKRACYLQLTPSASGKKKTYREQMIKQKGQNVSN